MKHFFRLLSKHFVICFAVVMPVASIWADPNLLANRKFAALPTTQRIDLGELLPRLPRLPFEPEYDRQMDRVLLSFQQSRKRDLIPWNMAHTLAALPVYTDVFANWTGSTDARFRDPGWLTNVAPHRFGNGEGKFTIMTTLDRWPQDLGEGQGNHFLIGGRSRGKAEHLRQVGFRSIRHILPLDGGDVTLARNESGEKIVFVGKVEFEDARSTFASRTYGDPALAARRAYLHTFSADRLAILEVAPQTHIDQWFFVPSDGVAVTEAPATMSTVEHNALAEFREEINKLAHGATHRLVPMFGKGYHGDTRRLRRSRDDAEAWLEEIPKKFLSPEQEKIWGRYQARFPHLFDLVLAAEHDEYRERVEARLRSVGFAVHRLRTSVRRLLNHERYVNATVFRNRATGRRTILLPVYGHPYEFPRNFLATSLKGANRGNVFRLRRLGFDVTPVPSEGFNGGNLHCSMYPF